MENLIIGDFPSWERENEEKLINLISSFMEIKNENGELTGFLHDIVNTKEFQDEVNKSNERAEKFRKRELCKLLLKIDEINNKYSFQ